MAIWANLSNPNKRKAKRGPGKRKQRRSDRLYERSIIVLIVLVVLFFGVIGAGGLIKVQLVNGAKYRADAEDTQLRDTVIAARRGTIYDCNMNVVAESSSAARIYINPHKIAEEPKHAEVLETVVRQLSQILEISEDGIRTKASYVGYGYMAVKYKVEKKQADAVRKFMETELLTTNAEGEEIRRKYSEFVGVDPDVIRYYPMKGFAANVLGFTGTDDIGLAGLELYYNNTLTGTPGRIIAAKSAGETDLPNQFKDINDPVQGTSLVLTIDQAIQRYLERSLEQAKIDAQAKAAYGIIMEVKTGAIKGMACVSSFDPNDYQAIADEAVRQKIQAIPDEDERAKAYNDAMFTQWRNGALEVTYEPGSVFKTITASAALEEGVADLNTSYTCTGAIQIGGRTIHCHNRNGHGTQNFTKGLMNSCNPYWITIGQKLGLEKFYQYYTAFGFTETTGIDLPNEAKPKPGITFHTKESMGIVELASCSFGQSFEASPIQIITAVSAIANGGKLMRPYVVAKELDESGRVVSETKPLLRRQVISEATAKTVAGMMEQVVSGGTGKNAYVAGGRIAGKTGTSEKLSVGRGYVASFCGFAPADNPEIAILIAIDEPVGLINGGQIAAPVVAEVMEDVLVYRNVEMRYTEKEQEELGGVTPNMVAQPVETARTALKNAGYSVRVIGDGASVLHQIPESGQSVPKGGLIILYTDESEASRTVTVPNLLEYSLSDASYLAARAGLNIKLVGNFESNHLFTYHQSIEEGTEVPLGTTVTVHFLSNNGILDR
ncbi:MAG: PASTA domain-containing protein [Oscillospiraceae bacterium]|jgi:stage V sporulation protein D (sporulation-specific penicillin-binding protein)|nr:PASTA domain-containing protein [Oscillospiraceae bacterium]